MISDGCTYEINQRGYLVEQIPPWTTFAKCMGTFKVNMDQCTTGPRDSHVVLMRKPTEIMANHRLLLAPVERKRRAGHRRHASVCNRGLSLAAQCTLKL
eukprot:9469834-Pyramimonas_sp.AAC.1